MSEREKEPPAGASESVKPKRSVIGVEDQWIAIQHKTFANWVNEQLSPSGRTVENLATDFCDGVKLVALIESLQFKKIGRVYKRPTSRIQMLENVGLAFRAIAEDNIRLVNIGNEDVVNGNLKLILGLLWHLILRYQISSSKTKAPPKKLMLAWFQSVLPDVIIKNFTTDWNDGLALLALIEYCRPGTCPNWKNFDPRNSVENCRKAMMLAKQHLNIPKVISAEDLASSALDELSAMTYLSYFIRRDSPGYYTTLNWVCRKLRNTTVSNLSTDWNDGYYLCAIVNALGGNVPGWPNLDRSDGLGNLQKGLDAARELGVDPILTAAEMADPSVDHLAIMAYLSKFQKVSPLKAKAEKLVISNPLRNVMEGQKASFALEMADNAVVLDKIKVAVSGPSGKVPHDLTWQGRTGECSFVPGESGDFSVHVQYDEEEIVGSPLMMSAAMDISKAKLLTSTSTCRVGDKLNVEVDVSNVKKAEAKFEVTSPAGDTKPLTHLVDHGMATAPLQLYNTGEWLVHVYLESKELEGSPVHVIAYDPNVAWVSGPTNGVVGEVAVFTVNTKQAGNDDVTYEVFDHNGSHVRGEETSLEKGIREIRFTPSQSNRYTLHVRLRELDVKGSPIYLEAVDPGQIVVSGDGVRKGIRGEETSFTVNTTGLGGNVTVNLQANGSTLETRRTVVKEGCYMYRYVPTVAGLYTLHVKWNGRDVTGSPFRPGITDRSCVTLMNDLTGLRDESDRLALEYGVETKLEYDVSKAGPGKFSAEILGPNGKLPVSVEQLPAQTDVKFVAKEEGDHYIHLYWCEAPLDSSPILAYCPGPVLPIDPTKVRVTGEGAEEARATVPAEFIIDGRKAGPGVPRVRLQGVKAAVEVDMVALKYDRYRCSYTAPVPGGFLLYVYWSDDLVPGCPYKVTVTTKGEVNKVKVTGEGLRGGIAGHELKVFVDTREAGPGQITATCNGARKGARCDVKENELGHYTVRIFPTEPEKHLLQIKYDGQQVTGSPFLLRIGEPPDASKVKVFGPGVEDGLIQMFQSRFLVDTHGAGAGQLAVRIRGPKGGFKVDITREGETDRTITCRYDPQEPGQYLISVRWSGDHVPGSPFDVRIFETKENFDKFLRDKGRIPEPEESQWRAEI